MTWLEGLLQTLATCRAALGPNAAHVHAERLRWIEQLVRAVAPEQLIREGRRRGGDPALRPQQTLARLVMEHTPDLISVLDEDGTFIAANSAHAQLLGHPPVRLFGTSVWSLIHPHDVMLANQHWERLKHQQQVQWVVRCQHANGSYRCFDARAAVAARGGGIQIVVVARDVTDQA